PDALFLSDHLDAVEFRRSANQTRPAARDVPEPLWAVVHAGTVRDVGCSPDFRLRLAALVAGDTAEHSGDGCRLANLLVSQWHDFLDIGLRRCGADRPAWADTGSGRSRPGIWFSSGDHRLSAGAVPGLLAARNDDFAPGCQGRFASQRDATAAAPGAGASA